MTLAKLAIFVGACVLAASMPPAIAQQNPDAKPPASATPAAATAAAPAAAQDADDTAALIAQANATAAANAKSARERATSTKDPIAPTANAAKKAREYGFHAEIYDGKTMFCKDDVTLGTRIKAKRCMNALEFEDYAVQLEYARDTMHKDVCQGGNSGTLKGPCGGLQ